MIKQSFISFLLLVSFYGHSQWTWKNPTPQGNDLYAVCFLNQDTGFVGGGVGTLMNTTDGGLSWDVNLLPYTRKYSTIRAISFPQGNVAYALDSDKYVFKSTDYGETWDTIYHEYEETLYDLYFTDSLHGCVINGNGGILRTDNGGKTWQLAYYANPTLLMSIYFVNHDTGFIAGWGGIILRTTDGGSTWDCVYTLTSVYWNSIRFFSPLQGIAIGDNKIARTFDGGQTWQQTLFTGDYGLNNVCYFNKDTLLITGKLYFSGARCFSSTDAGNTWDTIFPPGPFVTKALIGLQNGTAYGVGHTGLIVKSDDYGNTWEYITNFRSSNFHAYGFLDIDFPSENVGYVVSHQNGVMLKTIDGGLNWFELDTLFIMESFNTIKFATIDQGAIGGSSIFTTMDGGDRWVKRISMPFGKNIKSIDFATSLTGIAVGEEGVFYRTQDYGQCWSAVSNVPLIDYYKVCFANAYIGYVAGNMMLLKTNDAGITWQQIPLNFSPKSIDFISTEIGFAVGNNGLVKKTTNGGINWVSMPVPTSQDLLSVDFYDAEKGYVVGGNTTGIILKTIDGGLTWTEEYIPTYQPITDVCFSSSQKAYVCAYSQFLFENLDAGGVTGQNDYGKVEPIQTRLFPNPSSQTAYIKIILLQQTNLVVEIYASNGCKIKTFQIGHKLPGEYSIPIEVNNLQNGIYYYKVLTHYQSITGKWVVIGH